MTDGRRIAIGTGVPAPNVMFAFRRRIVEHHESERQRIGRRVGVRVRQPQGGPGCTVCMNNTAALRTRSGSLTENTVVMGLIT